MSIKIFFTVACPELAAEWHPILNNDLTPDSLGIGSHYVAWWRCKSDDSHVFQQSVAHRVAGRKCPFCRVSPLSLFVRFPEIAKQFHPTKNGDLNSRYVAAKTTSSAWWQCEKISEHVWEEPVVNRTSRKSSCPFCRGAKVSEDNTFARIHPELALEWHPTKNGDMTPETITSHFYKKVWWICKLKHEWQAKANVRITERSGCPFCAQTYLLKENSLAYRYPEIAAQWHANKNRKMLSSLQGSWVANTNRHLAPQDRPTNNRRLTPEDVSYGSHQKIWWQCARSDEHVWQAAVKERTKGQGCPYCSNRRISEENNLAARYPAVANQWHPTRNKPLLPSEVTPGSNKVIWWRCPRSGKHVWQAMVCDIIRSWKEGKNGCPFCSGKKVIDESSLAGKYPDVAKMWHVTLNEELTASQVTPSTMKIVHWQCPEVSAHAWRAQISNVVSANKKGRSGCPFCAGKRVSNETSLEVMYPGLAKLWHQGLNKTLQPDQVTPGSNKIVWWQCPDDSKHVWQRKIANQSDTWKRGRSSGCPECRAK